MRNRASKLSRIALFLALAFMLVLVPASADDNSCPCKNLQCLFSLVRQRNALAAGYDKIAAMKSLAITDAKGNTIDSFNSDGMSRATLKKWLAKIGNKKPLYEAAEQNLFASVPAAPDCAGGEENSASFAAKTNPVSCIIDQEALKAAQAAMPCEELGELLYAHEKYHFDQCMMRKHTQGQTLPYIWLTLTGLAKEEAAAYRRESEAIGGLIETCCG